jgi:uncharacterized membrane protein YphA (DoxX/SURF4 family)
MYPANAPGVPLKKMTPPWIPLPVVWGYLTGAIEIAAGALILADRQTRAAAAWMGLVVTVLVLVIYTPFLGVAVEGKDQLEALNYIWDTLLFAGTVLLIARAPGQGRRTRDAKSYLINARSKIRAQASCTMPR